MPTHKITSQPLYTNTSYPLGYNFFVVYQVEKVEQSRVLLYTSWDKASPVDKKTHFSIAKALYLENVDMIHEYLKNLDYAVLERLNIALPLINLDFPLELEHAREDHSLCFTYPSLSRLQSELREPDQSENEEPRKNIKAR